ARGGHGRGTDRLVGNGPLDRSFARAVSLTPFYDGRMDQRVWRRGNHALSLGERTLVMGIVNVTPDSFSDGAMFASVDDAVAHGARLVDEGADLVDVGGESTRPGSDPIEA